MTGFFRQKAVILAVVVNAATARTPAAAQQPPAVPAISSPTVQRQAAAMREQAGNVLFLRPQGWQRYDNPDGTVTLVPPGVTRWEVALTILQGGPLQGELRAWFDWAWQVVLQDNQVRVVKGGDVQGKQRDGFQVFFLQAVLQPLAGGGRTYASFFAAAPGTRFEAALFFAVNEALYNTHVAAVTTLWETVRFANLEPSAQPMATTPPLPSTAPGELQVESMYVGFGTNLGAASERYRFEFLVFYTNGLVYRGGAGFLTQGPDALALDNETVRQYHLGTYRLHGSDIHITWPGSKTEVIRREGDRLSIRGALGTPWQRLPRLDGLRLQGTYVPATRTAEPKWITFAPDGTFTEQGIVAYAGNLYFLERGIQEPSGGSGTYTIHDWALTLRYADGTVARMLCYVLPDDDRRRPRQLLINTYFLERAQ